MRSYTLSKVNGTPDWSKIPAMSIDNLHWTDSIDITAESKLCWDDNYIYVKLKAVEANIRMACDQPLDHICEDSCLEFFIQPTDRGEYINIEFNPLKNVWIGFGRTIDTSVRLFPEDLNELLHPEVEFTSDGWTIEYRLPVDFIKMFFPEFNPKVGLKFHGNTYKCGDKTVKPHYLAWNPIGPGAESFHRTECFGELILGGYV